MDPALLKIARAYRRRDGRRDEDEARDDLLDLYEHYTGEVGPVFPEYKAGRVDNGFASGAAFAARTAAKALSLGPLKYPAALLARQGVKRSMETGKLLRWIKDDRDRLKPLVKRGKKRR